MAPRISTLLALAFCMMATLLGSLSRLSDAQTVLATVTPPRPAVRPKPIVLTPSSAKPPAYKPIKPVSGGPAPAPPQLPKPNYYLFPPCTAADKAPNFANNDAPQCMKFSGYDFGPYVPTNAQKPLLCGEGCWPLIDRIMSSPVPSCSLVLNNIAINYIDAFYVIFGACVADPSKATILASSPAVPMPAPAVAPTVPISAVSPAMVTTAPSPAATKSASSAGPTGQFSLVISAVASFTTIYMLA